MESELSTEAAKDTAARWAVRAAEDHGVPATIRTRLAFGRGYESTLVRVAEPGDYRLSLNLELNGDGIEAKFERQVNQTAPRPVLAARVHAALDLHRPMRIYGPCGHDHQSGDPGTVDVDDVGVVCEDGFETTICRECCAGGVSQSEQCADEHRHSTGPCWPCPTYRALDVDAVAGLVERSSLGSPDAVAARGQVHPETGRVLAHASVRLAEIAAERDRIAVLDHATRFEFSDLPVGHPLRPAWAVDAVLCGSGTWEVRRGSWRLSRDGKWTTADGFSVEHQFDLDTALVVAKQAAHEMTIGTYTAAEVLAADEEGDCDD